MDSLETACLSAVESLEMREDWTNENPRGFRHMGGVGWHFAVQAAFGCFSLLSLPLEITGTIREGPKYGV